MGKMELIIMGSGTSGCVPNVSCLIETPIQCTVCPKAILPQSKNFRRNTSAVVTAEHKDGRRRNFVLDCGKTFYESALAHFVKYKLQLIDAVILTHGHADAILGLDDLRQWTLMGKLSPALQKSVRIYLDAPTMEVVGRCFPYMVDTSKATGEVAALQFHIIQANVPFTIDDQLIIPFEEHGVLGDGKPYYALGFRIGDISYISDTSKLPRKAKNIIKGSRLIVMDALRSIPHVSHFSYDQALEALSELMAPEGKGLFTGLTHEMEHDDIDRYIKSKTNLDISCAFDGLKIVLND